MVNGTRPTGSRPTGSDQRPTLGALVADITSEVGQLVRGEIDLAKAEIRESARKGATGAGLIAVAAVLLAMVGLLFTWAAVYGLTALTGLPIWASFLIVGGVYLLIAILLALLGAASLKKARGPEQAVAEMQRTKEIFRSLPPTTAPSSNGVGATAPKAGSTQP